MAGPAGVPGKQTRVDTMRPVTATEPAPFRIVKEQPAAVVGETARFSVPGAEKYTRKGERYLCTWTIHFDQSAPEAKQWPDTYPMLPTQNDSQPYVRLKFEFPGTHRVTCETRWDGAGPPPDAPSHQLETLVVTRRLDDISRDAIRDYDKLVEGNRVIGELVDKHDPVAAKRNREARAAHDKVAAEHVQQLVAGTQVPLRATISDRANGRSYPLTMAIGVVETVIPNPRGGGPIRRKGYRVLDLTRGAARIEYDGDSPDDALDTLRSGNSYPPGLLEIEVPPNDHGIPPLKKQYVTTGMSSLQEWAHALGLISMGLAGVATVFTGGLATPLLVWASTTTMVAAAGAQLADHLKAAKVDRTTLMIDVLQLTAAALPFLGAATRLATGATFASRLAHIPPGWVQLGQFGLDGVSGVLITVDAYRQLLVELARPELQGEENRAKRDLHIAQFFTTLIQVGLVVGISGASVRQRTARGSTPPHDDPRVDPAGATPPKTPPPAPDAAMPATARSKIDDLTAADLANHPPDTRVRVSWIEDGIRREGEMTVREARAKLDDPRVSRLEIDSAVNKLAPTKLPPPSADVAVGQRFGTARVVEHDVVAIPITVVDRRVIFPHDRIVLELADGQRLAVYVPQSTVPGGPGWGARYHADPALDHFVNERLPMLDAIGKTDPRLFAGTSEIVLVTDSRFKMHDGRMTTADGFFSSEGSRLAITPNGLHGDIAQVIRHEGGHGVGYRLAPGVGYTPGFFEAHARDGGLATPYLKHLEANHWQGVNRGRETYAEAHRLYAENPAAFRASHKEMAAIIERDLAELARGVAEGRYPGRGAK